MFWSSCFEYHKQHCVCVRRRKEGEGRRGEGREREKNRKGEERKREREKEREGGRKGVHSSAVPWAGSHETRHTNSNRLNQER